MYFLIAGISVLLNVVIMFAYKLGVEKANKAATVATTFTWVVMLGNLIVWCVAASLYRTEKDKGGKSNDLWGWTCSPLAREIQKEFAVEVDFDKFCNVQVSLRMRCCEGRTRVNGATDYFVVHWARASWDGGLDRDHICIRDSEEKQEEGHEEAAFTDGGAVPDKLLGVGKIAEHDDSLYSLAMKLL
jgi:hypothetical protein